ncbi:MAG TPA: molybdopterin-dependent oxidoreductase [Acidimicrobiales bacterium]|nr:molybdopterin-dependent oxidoreductase [Acidimicrobiales bacterium]
MEDHQDKGSPVGRRVVLGMLGLGAIGVVTGSAVQDGLDSLLAPVQRNDPTGISDLLPGDHFRVYTVIDGVPYKSDADYRLVVDGLVDRPLELTLADLQGRPSTTLVRAFQCVTGWRVPGVHWQGVLLSHLLDEVGVQSGARALRFRSFDGVYTESLTLAEARRSDVIVAYSMSGQPLSTDHGGPVRLYVAPMYGYKSIKWLSHIEVVDRVEPGYWETEGNYDVEAWVGRSNGRNDPAT